MTDAKNREHSYSNERTETTMVDTPSVVTKTVSPQIEKGGEFWEQTRYRPKTDLVKSLKAGELPSLAEFKDFGRKTRGLWLTLAAAIIGLVAAANVWARVAEWARNTRVKRQEQAVATLTPEHLVARCGATAQDVTKEVFPIAMRRITYELSGREKLVFAFSRTMEAKSDWVFLSMDNESRGENFQTTEAKMAAMPCLDSTK
jgi:hypothetical protein